MPTSSSEIVHPVLVVDDDPVVRRLLCVTLRKAGLRVEEAATGAEALSLARRRPYAAVLLDSNMPGMTGLEVLAQLRAVEETRTLPVLLVTGEDEVGARVFGLQQGADDYITKPFHPDELVARVRAQLREQAAWSEVLERRLGERSAIAAALCRMHPQATAERTAEVLCDQVRELRHLAGAAVVVFVEDTMAVPVAVRGVAPPGVSTGVPVAPAAAARLLARAGRGPWLDRHTGGIAWAPFGGQDPIGVLALVPAGNGPGGTAADAQLLAAAIDFAAVAGGLLTPSLLAGDERDVRRARLAEVLRQGAFVPVFQPIVRLPGGDVIGFEALTRFSDGAQPQARFAEAAALDLGLDMERATLAAAVQAASGLPPDCWVSLNVSPALVLEGRSLRELLRGCRSTVVLELTEHDPVEDYTHLSSALDELRPATLLSVDDAGSGFASLRHVLTLGPDFVKLDQSWVTGIHDDPARQALVAGLCHFSSCTGSLLIAEGIETPTERGMLEQLDVDLGQGYLFGHPVPVTS